MEESLRGRGALIFPKLEKVPFNPYRGQLYTPQELYAGIAETRYEDTLDARVYQWSIRPGQRHRLDATLAAALHDHSIGDALDELTRSELCPGRTMVGVMGGHAASRGSAGFTEAALLGRLLARNGRRGRHRRRARAPWRPPTWAPTSARRTKPDFQRALADLAAVPGFRPSVSAWARAAAAVVERHPDGTPSLGIPTWFYGHEPPNFFATHIAKYFANAIREAILLELCNGGIIFLPGSGGTVQEIFQDACENYYGAPETITPMVLVGEEHWLRTIPGLAPAAEPRRGPADGEPDLPGGQRRGGPRGP